MTFPGGHVPMGRRQAVLDMTGRPPPSTPLTQALHDADPQDGLTGLSAAHCATALGLDGLTVVLATTTGPGELIWFDPADELGPAMDDLQFTLGDGPTVEVAHTGLAILQADLATASTVRWPMFTPAALGLGIRVVIAFPLTLGAIRLGVLTGYRTTPGPLTSAQRGDFHALIQGIAFLVLTAPEATIGLPSAVTDRNTLHRAEVHQATGVLSVRLTLPLHLALLRLRAYAFSHNRALLDVARAVLDGDLRHLDGDQPDDD